MQKLNPADVRGPAAYEAVRPVLRQKVIDLKKRRRILVGPQVSLVFENRETILFQVEEMCRAENISTPDKIADEVAVYNRILPDEDGALGATLFVEMTNERIMEQTLNKLVGLQNHVWLLVANERAQAQFDPAQFAADKLAAVQYLHFPLSPAAQAAIKTSGTEVAVRIDHPNYRHQSFFNEEGRAELARDVSA